MAIVADGIGGHQAGEIASEITVETIIERINKDGLDEPIATMRSAIIEAGVSVYGAAEQSGVFYGMGSTVAMVCVIGQKLFTSYVGDSRIYLHRRGIVSELEAWSHPVAIGRSSDSNISPDRRECFRDRLST